MNGKNNLQLFFTFLLFFCLSSCSGESETTTPDALLPSFYNLHINFTEPDTELGVVNIEPNDLICRTSCTSNLAENTDITLTAKAKNGAYFVSWGGACSGEETCTVNMSSEQTITATFSTKTPTYSLSVQISEGGEVAVKDSFYACSADSQCNFTILEDEAISIEPIAEEGYVFTGWAGDCYGKTSCELTMSRARSLTATFEKIPSEALLTVNIEGKGSSLVSNSTENCDETCQITFTQPEAITLTPVPAQGYAFYGWSGDCAGNANCIVDMTVDQSVTAIFKATSHECTAQASLPAGHFDTQFPYNNPAFDGNKIEVHLTEFVVKESTGYGANNFPVTMVFPVEEGAYFHPGDFYIKDNSGQVVPAQFNVLNRWWGKDNSLRHIQAHFNVDINAYSTGAANTGVQYYSLYYGNGNTNPSYSACVTETNKSIVLDNGLVDITITKDPLTITTPAGDLKSLLITETGEDDYSFDRDNIAIEIEEIGLLRSVVKISSLTNYVGPEDIKHGWALRLYMYADSDKVKVDFQLQNSAINTPISAPLYFQSHTLRIDNATVSETLSTRADTIPTAEIENLPLGVIHTDKVNVMLRNFWQTFPNGLAASTEGNIEIELWPTWSKQFHIDSFVEPDLYWLDDMKQTYKEVLLDFSAQSEESSIQATAKAFQYPPVAVIPQDYYAQTRVTTNYGGAFPIKEVATPESRIPSYIESDYNAQTYSGYKFGMDNFGIDIPRKWSTGMAGGWPYSKQQFFISGDTVDYYNAQDFAQAEINIRPQWLSGYKDELHFDLLTPSTNPYGGNTWRRFLGHSYATSNRDYLTGTSRSANPRDDQHAWFYHVEHAYLMSGNKWIKDWYEFMAEFKKIYLSERDPFPDSSHRAEGEALAIALSAYKYTGSESFRPFVENYIEDIHNKYVVEPHYIRPDKDNDWKIAAFQLGYLLREFIGIYTEFPANPVALETIENYVKWNYEYGQFSYYRSVTDTSISTTTSETSLSLVDSVIWFAIETQKDEYAEHAINYVEVGLNGVKPYGSWASWVGQFEAPMYQFYLQ